MKLPASIILLISSIFIYAQDYKSNTRLSFDPALEPFYHGVASGDPLPDRVMRWTRITISTPGSVNVQWEMATDLDFENIVAGGIATTDESIDHTIKVDVGGLSPSHYYYYRFEHDGKKSITGRTKTAPTGDNEYLRFAVVSCNNYQNGYFNAFKHLAERNDIDAVIHLGDYIYEGGVTSTPGAPGRLHEPTHETITLEDYRGRYSHYRLDPDFRALHQQHPFICAWDDHETANNSWRDGAQGHTEGAEGLWADRKLFGAQANFEWLPNRVNEAESLKIYRKLAFGDLADLHMLETRLLERTEPVSGQIVPLTEPGLWDSTNTMLGVDQMQWWQQNMLNSQARWQIIGQQVMFTPLYLPVIPILVPQPSVANPDQWNGYAYERQQILNFIKENDINNFVVLTGDIHSSWAADLPDSNYNASTGANSRGVEFITTSITSSNTAFALVPTSVYPDIEQANLHIKYYDLFSHGYLILDISKDRVQSDWYFVSTIEQQEFTVSVDGSWYCNNGESYLREASVPANSPVNPDNVPLAPIVNPTSVKEHPSIVIVSSFPNPFTDHFIVQFYSEQTETVELSVTDMAGHVLINRIYPASHMGINYVKIDAQALSAGNYIVWMTAGNDRYRRNIMKIE